MKERGFTIIEVVVAITIFSIVMLCSLSFFSFGNDIVRRSKEQTYALQIAKNEIAYSKIACVSSCPPFSNPSTLPQVNIYEVPELHVTFRSELNWQQQDGNFGSPKVTYADWYKVVTVTVTWNSAVDNGSPRSVFLNTMASLSPFHD